VIVLNSSDIVYSEHGDDECFEYKNGSGRVPDGIAVGFLREGGDLAGSASSLTLFEDIKYSSHSHEYWDNYELEHDASRIFLP